MSHTPPPPSPDNVANNTVDVFDSTGSHLLFSTTGSSALTSAVNFANAQSGDIVSAGNGTYTGDLHITSAMTVESANGAGNVTTIGDGTSIANDGAIRISADNVQIGGEGHGLTVQMDGTEQGAIYISTPTTNTVIDGNTLVGATNANPAEDITLIATGGQHNLTVNDNTFTGTVDSFAVYINGQANVGNPSWGSFTDNHIQEQNTTVVLDFGSNQTVVPTSLVEGNHFDGNNSFMVLQDAGELASQNTGAELSTINGGFTLHGNEELLTTTVGGPGSAEQDIVLNWHPDVGINLDDNWLGASLTATSTNDISSNEVQVDVSNGGEIDLFSNHVTVAQVESDYGFA